MLTFEILNEENKSELIKRFTEELGDGETVAEIIEAFFQLSDEEGIEVAHTTSHGCLLVRIFDAGRYSFVYPIDIREDADIESTLTEIANYARRELIPLYFTDAPREELDRVGRVFPHIEARAYDEDEDSFVISIMSECDMLSDVPTFTHGDILLSQIDTSEIAEYARLCRDDEVNRYWGYDYKGDETDVTDEYFLRVTEAEFSAGVALALAVRERDGENKGKFLGEGVLFDFDYRGSAMVAIRLLPEYQGRGIGTRALEALIALAKDIGIKTLNSKVLLANTRSVKMTERKMPRLPDDDGKAVFVMNLQ